MKGSNELEREICDFILWLTPCGEVEPAPTIETIGREARKLNKKILTHWNKSKHADGCQCERCTYYRVRTIKLQMAVKDRFAVYPVKLTFDHNTTEFHIEIDLDGPTFCGKSHDIGQAMHRAWNELCKYVFTHFKI